MWVGLSQSSERPEEQNWRFPEEEEILSGDCSLTSCLRVFSLPASPAGFTLASPHSSMSKFLAVYPTGSISLENPD